MAIITTKAIMTPCATTAAYEAYFTKWLTQMSHTSLHMANILLLDAKRTVGPFNANTNTKADVKPYDTCNTNTAIHV